MSNKIRPPTHSSNQSDPRLRAEAEGDLDEIARVPDPNRSLSAIDAIDVSANATFSPLEAVQLRREMNEPNGLGLPHRPNEAEKLLARYTQALADYRADYQATRSERLRIPFLEAKQAMIDAGLMKGDV